MADKTDRPSKMRAFRLAAKGKIEKGRHHLDKDKKPEAAHRAFMQTVKRSDAQRLGKPTAPRAH
jgi:hypothetical protein